MKTGPRHWNISDPNRGESGHRAVNNHKQEMNENFNLVADGGVVMRSELRVSLRDVS